MDRWEYTKFYSGPNDRINDLNVLGNDGWEVICCDYCCTVYLLKRKLE